MKESHHFKHSEREKKESNNHNHIKDEEVNNICFLSLNNIALKAFKDQEIDKIRQSECLFTDSLLKPSINFIVNDPMSTYCKTLFSHFECKNRFDLKELETKIRWERSQVKSKTEESIY